MAKGEWPKPFSQGQHAAVTGMVGSGKSFLLTQPGGLLSYRDSVVFFRSKAELPALAKVPGYKRVRKADQVDIREGSRWILDPLYVEQAHQFATMLERVWKEGKWTVALDELYYLEKMLRLSAFSNRLLTQGRSKKISVILGAQRPVEISRFALGEATILICFAGDSRDAVTIADATEKGFGQSLLDLGKYEFSLYYKPDREWHTGTIETLGSLLVKA